MPWHCFESRGWIGPYIKDRHKEAGPSTPKGKFLEFGASNHFKHCGTSLIFTKILLPRCKACAGHQDQAAKRHCHRTRCSIVEISVPVIASIRLLCQAACDFLIIFFVLYCYIAPVDEPQRIWTDLKWSWIVLICSPRLHWINHIGAQASKKHQPMHLNNVWMKTIAAWLLFWDHKVVVAQRCSYSVHVLSLYHLFSQSGRTQNLRKLRTLSMRMRALQNWTEAVSEAVGFAGISNHTVVQHVQDFLFLYSEVLV